MRARSLQSCPTLCDPMDCSLPGSSVHGVLQAGILEWVAVSSSGGSFQPRSRTRISYIDMSYLHANLLHWHAGSLPLAPPGKPMKRHTGPAKTVSRKPKLKMSGDLSKREREKKCIVLCGAKRQGGHQLLLGADHLVLRMTESPELPLYCMS